MGTHKAARKACGHRMFGAGYLHYLVVSVRRTEREGRPHSDPEIPRVLEIWKSSAYIDSMYIA